MVEGSQSEIEQGLTVGDVLAKFRRVVTKHSWSNGMMRAFQAREPGSIPGECTDSFASFDFNLDGSLLFIYPFIDRPANSFLNRVCARSISFQLRFKCEISMKPS